jgi:acyl-coenzyme A thioesterase PaaI-like protein
MDREKEAFQDLIGPENHCHGCGCANEKGLQLKSYWDGDKDESIAVFKPAPHHSAGMAEYVNGGIIASVIDCHGNNLAMALAYHRAGRKVGSLPKIWCVTGRLEIDYKLPVPIDCELLLRARLLEQEGRKSWIECLLYADDLLCVRGKLLQIEIARD